MKSIKKIAIVVLALVLLYFVAIFYHDFGVKMHTNYGVIPNNIAFTGDCAGYRSKSHGGYGNPESKVNSFLLHDRTFVITKTEFEKTKDCIFQDVLLSVGADKWSNWRVKIVSDDRSKVLAVFHVHYDLDY